MRSRIHNTHQIITKDVYEHRVRSQMQRERKDTELRQTINDRIKTKAFCESLNKVDGMRRLKKSEMRSHQLKNVQEYQRQQESEEEAKREEMISRSIMAELDVRNRQTERTEAKKRRICSSSQELKQLKEKLNALKISCDLKQQISEQKVTELEQEQSNYLLEKQIEERSVRAQAQLDEKALLTKQKLFANKKIIENQIREKELKKAVEYEEYLREKKEVQKILEKLESERRVKCETEERKKLETKRYIEAYLIEREKFLLEAKCNEEQMNAKIREWNAVQEARLEAQSAAKRAKIAAEQEKYEAVRMTIERENEESSKMQDLINELAMEETQLKLIREEQRKYEKQMRLRESVKRENENQLRLKKILRVQELENEERLRQSLLERYERDAKLDQLSAHKKRLKRMQYKKDVQQIIEERQRLREAAKHFEVEQELKQNAIKNETQDIIRAERMRLIKQYAPHLGQFLNTRIAENDDERDIIRQFLQ